MLHARVSLFVGIITLGAVGGACSEGKVSYLYINAAPPDAAAPAPAVSDGSELGTGDGTPGSVVFTEIYSAPNPAVGLVDLAFNADDPTQVWAIGRTNDSVHLGRGVTETENGTWKEMIDPAALHFMHLPPALAWGADGFWGICGDNDNSQNDPRHEGNDFMGPALFTSDLKIFGKETAGGLGSHYDMLHSTSFCRGIAHESANWFWTFNGARGALDRYNFNQPHEPGGDDHHDGEIYRYAAGQVKGVEGESSHIFFDATDKFLYVADSGNGRIVKLDTTKGTEGTALPRNEILKKSANMLDTLVEVVVPPGTLTTPSGLEVHGGLIFVNDSATGIFHVFDKTGRLIRSLDTGLGAKTLSGFTFGPDNKIWFTDRKRGKILRIDSHP